MLIDSDQHVVSRSTTEPLRSCLPGGAALQFYPVVKAVFLRRTTYIKNTKGVAPTDTCQSTLNASKAYFFQHVD